jgi:uncharacterized protein YkwD
LGHRQDPGLHDVRVMNAIDLVLLLVMGASLWAGWRRGFAATAADLVALAASLGLAFFLYPHAVRVLEQHGLQWGAWAAPLAFIAICLIARGLLGFVMMQAVRGLPAGVHGHRVNRGLGVLPGAANGLINAVIVAMVLLTLPLSDTMSRAARESALAERLAGPAEWLEAALRPIFNPALDQTLGKLTLRPDSRASLSLPFKVQNPVERPDLEASMLALLNEARRSVGLTPLRSDPEATAVAREHSRDMFTRGYFSHVTPQGEDPFDRMRKGGLRFLAAGENLALARTVAMAHQGLMDSPGHRANILRPSFGRVGIGIVDGGRYGLMVTQNFRN